MDPVKDFNIRDIDMVTTIARKQSLEDQMANYKCLDCPKFTEHVSPLLLYQNSISTVWHEIFA